MVYILNKKTSLKDFNKILSSLSKKRKRKGVNTLKYCGFLTLKKDPLAIQKELRDEWE